MNAKQVSNLIDMKLVTREGGLLGRVDELLIEQESGRIAYIVAEYRDGKRRTIPWNRVECEAGVFRLLESAGPQAE